MLTWRLSSLLVIVFVYVIVLLSNDKAVDINVLSFSVSTQVSIVIFVTTCFGVFLAIYVTWIFKNINSLKKRVKDYKKREAAKPE